MTIDALATSVAAGDRRALARAITLIESEREDHRAEAEMLLGRLGPLAAGKKALRLGLTGAPGVGKSTFIEAFGLYLTGQGLRVAVLAVDPSSQRSGGSLLGDKTRMEGLSRVEAAFVRPSPSGVQPGGVARRTRDTTTLCEAAGFDVIVIETVGVGQSETMAADMVDVFALLIAPAGGDELQGVKRGIMERADLILVNKADGDLRAQAEATRTDYANALRLLHPQRDTEPSRPRAICVSALEGRGVDTAWQVISSLAAWRQDSGVAERIRADQARAAFQEEVTAALLAKLTRDPELAARMTTLEAEVVSGRLSPAAAAAQALDPESGGGLA